MYLHIVFEAGWTWDDFYTMRQDARAKLDTVDYSVAELLDFREARGHIPPNVITHFRKVAREAHPNRGAVIVLSPRLMLIKVFANTILRFLPSSEHFHLVSSIEEAHAILDTLAENDDETHR